MRQRFSYFLELSWMLFLKLLGTCIPGKLKFRFYKCFYDYQSSRFKGVQLIVPYYPSLNLQFLINTKYLIDWNVFFFGHYEKETNDILFQYIKPGQVVLEAGANNGTETVLLSRIVGGTGKIFAFEPVTHIHDTLKINLSINRCENVFTETLALGASNKEVFFYVRTPDHCNQGMASQTSTKAPHTTVGIQQVALDSWIQTAGIDRIDFIKMDIQGAEIDLLKGAQECITKYHPIIFTEATADFLSLEELYDALSSLGYEVSIIQAKGVTQLLSKTSLQEGNWLAKPKSIHS